MSRSPEINRSRRNFLRVGAAGSAVIGLGALSDGRLPFGASVGHAAPLPNHRRLVVINMLGGNDALNTVIPVTGAAASEYLGGRPTIGIAQGQGLSLAAGPGSVTEYELHPVMDKLQARWNAGQLAIINKVGYPQANLSHFVSEDIWSWGARSGLSSLTGVAPGWVARFANAYTNTSMGVASIGVGRRLDFAGANVNPFLVASLTAFNFDVDWNYQRNHELRKTKVESILALQPTVGAQGNIAASSLGAHTAAAQLVQAIADYDADALTRTIQYPLRPGSATQLTGMGSRLRDIARLIHGGFETRVFYTGYGGFDTHSGQATRHAELLDELDEAIGVFHQDLSTMQNNPWADTCIVVITEFGRRNFENGSDGTDHGHGIVCLVVGGTVNGGLYGSAISQADVAGDFLPYTTDFRDIYRNLVQDHLGEDPTSLFPESQPISTPIDVIN